MVATKSPAKPKKTRVGRTDAAVERAEKTMNKALADKVAHIKDGLRKLTESDIERRWELGCEIHEVMTDTSGQYGDDPAEAIQALMPLSRDSLRPMVVMAQRYDKDDIKRLITMRHKRTGEGLTWTHVMAISRVKDKTKAMSLAEKAVTEGWSSKDLVRAVVDAQGGPKSPGGRKRKKASDLSEALSNIIDAAQSMVRAVKNDWLAEGGLTDLAATAKPSLELVRRLDLSVTGVDELTGQLAILGRQLALMRLQHQSAVATRKAV